VRCAGSVLAVAQCGLQSRAGRARWIAFLLLISVLFVAPRWSRFLVVDQPMASDAIVVLAGDDERMARALQLLRQGVAREVIVDADDSRTIYGKTDADRAQVVARGQVALAGAITICAMDADSTLDEAQDVASCLKATNAHTVMLVTSDFHTRRALAVFRHELPGYQWSVAATGGDVGAGNAIALRLQEGLKLVWWQAVDRWNRVESPAIQATLKRP
jgi:uncharacterized SAM-binding protein YcdF (DUF218 family)